MPVDADRPRRAAGIESALIDDQAVLFVESSGVVHELSPAATLVWSMLDGQSSPEEIAEEIARELTASTVDLAPQVRQVISHFRSVGLVLTP